MGKPSNVPSLWASQECSGLLRPFVLTIRPSEMNRSLTSMAALKKSAGIEAEVQDQAAKFLLLELCQDLLQFGGRVGAEGREPHVADVLLRIEHELPLAVRLSVVAEHGFDVDFFADERDFRLLVLAGMHHRQRDRVPSLPLSRLTASSSVDAVGAVAVDFDNAVAGQDAGAIGGRAVDRAQARSVGRRRWRSGCRCRRTRPIAARNCCTSSAPM